MTNLERADTAEDCLIHFMRLTGVDTTHDAAGDLIANIGHYCQSNGLDFIDVLKTAIGHWHLEQTNEDSIDTLPNVTINIELSGAPQRYSKSETIITITKEAHDALIATTNGSLNLSEVTLNSDGTVSFPIQLDTYRNLMTINPNIEVAVRTIVGLKAH